MTSINQKNEMIVIMQELYKKKDCMTANNEGIYLMTKAESLSLKAVNTVLTNMKTDVI